MVAEAKGSDLQGKGSQKGQDGRRNQLLWLNLVNDAMDRVLPGGDVQPREPQRSAVVLGLGLTQILAWGSGVDCLGPDGVSFGEIKRRAFSILERDKIKRAADFIGAHSIDVTALEGEFVGRFQRKDSNRLFQSFSSRNAKKEKGKPTPAFPVVTMTSNGLWTSRLSGEPQRPISYRFRYRDRLLCRPSFQ